MNAHPPYVIIDQQSDLTCLRLAIVTFVMSDDSGEDLGEF